MSYSSIARGHDSSNDQTKQPDQTRPDQSDSVCRMPMEYVTNFFSATNINSVGKHVVSYILLYTAQDYRSRLCTASLVRSGHHGPMWSVSELHGTSHQWDLSPVEYSSMQEEAGGDGPGCAYNYSCCMYYSLYYNMMFLLACK